jgi:hypothetical protein
MVARQIVGGKLRRDTTPAEGKACADHRDDRARSPQRSKQVGQHAGEAKADEHDRDRQGLARVVGIARRRRQGGADDPEHDRGHRDVLVAAGVLAQHALPDEQQHQQAGSQCRLHDDQWRQQQSHNLQRPAEDRQSRSEQPAGASEESRDECQPQVLLVGCLACVQRLQGDP